MANRKQGAGDEPSMEEILSSIRQIISEDTAAESSAGDAVEAAAADDDDVLDLTEEVAEESPQENSGSTASSAENDADIFDSLTSSGGGDGDFFLDEADDGTSLPIGAGSPDEHDADDDIPEGISAFETPDDDFMADDTPTAMAEEEAVSEEEKPIDDTLIHDAGIDDAGIDDAEIDDAGIDDAGIDDAEIDDTSMETSAAEEDDTLLTEAATDPLTDDSPDTDIGMTGESDVMADPFSGMNESESPEDIEEPELVTEPDPTPEPESDPMPEPESPEPEKDPVETAQDGDDNTWVSPQTATQAGAALQQIAKTAHDQEFGGGQKSDTDRILENMVRDALQPQIKTWLDENLPGLVERIVREEIRRMTRKAEAAVDSGDEDSQY